MTNPDEIFAVVPSPVGELLLTATAAGLTGIRFEQERHPRPAATVPADDLPGVAAETIALTRAQLEAYFTGRATEFTVPLAASGTAFQRRVWAALAEIPFGETVSYGELARRVGSPAAVRAVGGANGRNPIPIIVPCHRVIGADGSLTGFGGGIARKRWLLQHEGALPDSPPDLWRGGDRGGILA